MREIKFRGWYTGPYVNRMLAPNFNGPVNEIFNDPDNEGKVIYMQYTGLKDKNGKEIYEGDILLAEYGSHNEMLSYFVVQMIDGCWGAVIYYDFPIENDCFYWRYANEFNDHEVIGNIYENPELLEATA